MTDRKKPRRGAAGSSLDNAHQGTSSTDVDLADRTFLPKRGDVAKIVAMRRRGGRVWLLIYDRLTEPLIVADLDEEEVQTLREVLERVAREP